MRKQNQGSVGTPLAREVNETQNSLVTLYPEGGSPFWSQVSVKVAQEKYK